MRTRIVHWLRPPVFEGDESKTQLAYLVNLLGFYYVSAILVAAAIFVPLFAADKLFDWLMCGVLLGVYAFSRRLLFSGRVESAASLVLVNTWAIFQAVAVVSGGIASPATLVVLMMVVLGGLLAGRRTGLVMTVLSILVSILLLLVDYSHVFTPYQAAPGPLSAWFFYVIILSFTFASVRVVIDHFRRERQLAEEHLLSQQARLQQAQNLARMGVWEWDPVSDRTTWSDEMLAIYGITRAEFTGRGEDYLNFTLPEDRSIQRENIRRDFAQAALAATALGRQIDPHPDPKDFRIVRKDGAVRWVRGDAVEIVDAQGRPLRMHGILWDVTDQKLSEQKLRDSEARFRAVVEHSQDGIVFMDRQRTVLYVSPSYARITGWEIDEMVGKSGVVFVHPDDQSLTAAHFSDLLSRPGGMTYLEYRICHKGGDWRWIATKATNLLDEPNVQAMVIASQDITVRKAAEEKVLMLNLGIEHSNDAIFVTDPQGVITYINPAFEKIYGYTREETVGLTPRIIKSGILPKSIYQTFWQNLLDGKSVVGEIINRTKAGRILTIEASNNPILAEGGRVIGFMGIHRDITDRKQAEEKLQQSELKYRELFQANLDGISIFVIHPNNRAARFVEVNEAAHMMIGLTREEMLACEPHDLELDVSPEELQTRQQELNSRGIVHFETVLRHKDGGQVYAEFTAQVIQYEGQIAVMNIVHDITERKQRELELEAIATISAALRTAIRRAEMLPAILENLVELLNADCVTIEIQDPVSGDAVTEAACGIWKNLAGTVQPRDTGLNALIARTLKPYYLRNLQAEPAISNLVWEKSGLVGMVGVPMIAQEQLIGFIWIGSRREVSGSQQRLLTAVADIAANAIRRSSLHEQTVSDAVALNLAYDSTLEGWARALELRDQETEGHSQRVTNLTLALAKQFQFDPAGLVHLRRGAILHDIGKMGIPDAILRKPGPLTDEEWVVMRKHPQYAYDMLSSIEYLRPALGIPYCHHEKWDGSGYPRGLQGEEIPLAARIFAVADVWDALRADRVYRRGWPEERVLAFIQEQTGTHFDPQVVEKFFTLREHNEDLINT